MGYRSTKTYLLKNQAKNSRHNYITFSEIYTYLGPHVTLRMRSRSSKSNQLLGLSHWYIHTSLVTFCPICSKANKKLLCRCQHSKFISLRPPVTFKMGSKSPKLNQPFGLSQWCTHTILVNFHTMIQEIWWICHAAADALDLHWNEYVPPPHLWWGDMIWNIMDSSFFFLILQTSILSSVLG